jgi:hypothetical protein
MSSRGFAQASKQVIAAARIRINVTWEEGQVLIRPVDDATEHERAVIAWVDRTDKHRELGEIFYALKQAGRIVAELQNKIEEDKECSH